MTTRPKLVLVIGATGSIGRLVVAEARRQGYATRALVRDLGRGRRLGPDVDLVLGDVTRPETLLAAVAGVDAVVFTHGSDGGGKVGSETVDYGAVRNVLAALQARRVRIALMTAIGVTNRRGSYNASTESHDWNSPRTPPGGRVSNSSPSVGPRRLTWKQSSRGSARTTRPTPTSTASATSTTSPWTRSPRGSWRTWRTCVAGPVPDNPGTRERGVSRWSAQRETPCCHSVTR